VALATGLRLGAYEIVSLLGAGGMGEVYRAQDTKLGRAVAIKVLPQALASAPDRIARFEREAKALAAFNHPHIATLYGTEESCGQYFLVMELVEGETLADRLEHAPIPVKEALTIARQIADALDASHEKGIVHRDLKPANIKITSDGIVKVLDFGLAKAASTTTGPVASQSPTITVAGTREGVILGTAAYMSPEQARGQTSGRLGACSLKWLAAANPLRAPPFRTRLRPSFNANRRGRLCPGRFRPRFITCCGVVFRKIPVGVFEISATRELRLRTRLRTATIDHVLPQLGRLQASWRSRPG
jgi:serine/threonine protein kinase